MTDILIAFIFGAFVGAGLLIFTACMGKECACFKEDSVDAYCDRNGAFMLMTKEVTE